MEENGISDNLLSFIWKPLIKPLRVKYEFKNFFDIKNLNYEVIPFTVTNNFHEEIQSYIIINKDNNIDFKIIKPDYKKDKGYISFTNYGINSLTNTIIFYLHTHNSCSIESLEILKHVLSKNGILITFDFRGHGKSGGNFCSVGFFESLDLDAVINKVKNIFNPNIYKFILWGRSMGAITSILYNSINYKNLLKKKYNIKITNQDLIKGIIIDSPYYSLKTAIKNYIESISYLIPDFVINSTFGILKEKFKNKMSINIDDLNILNYSTNLNNIFLFFLVGDKDEFINMKQIENLFNSFNSKNKRKKIIKEGIHQNRRQDHELIDCINFINCNLQNRINYKDNYDEISIKSINSEFKSKPFLNLKNKYFEN